MSSKNDKLRSRLAREAGINAAEYYERREPQDLEGLIDEKFIIDELMDLRVKRIRDDIYRYGNDIFPLVNDYLASAVLMLGHLMRNGSSEKVRLQAAKEILYIGGFKPNEKISYELRMCHEREEAKKTFEKRKKLKENSNK
ncbi:MAG: hypothetical protein ABII18_05795 [bacterium]